MERVRPGWGTGDTVDRKWRRKTTLNHSHVLQKPGEKEKVAGKLGFKQREARDQGPAGIGGQTGIFHEREKKGGKGVGDSNTTVPWVLRNWKIESL